MKKTFLGLAFLAATAMTSAAQAGLQIEIGRGGIEIGRGHGPGHGPGFRPGRPGRPHPGHPGRPGRPPGRPGWDIDYQCVSVNKRGMTFQARGETRIAAQSKALNKCNRMMFGPSKCRIQSCRPVRGF